MLQSHLELSILAANHLMLFNLTELAEDTQGDSQNKEDISYPTRKRKKPETFIHPFYVMYEALISVKTVQSKHEVSKTERKYLL